MRINAKKRVALIATTTAAVLLGGGIAAAYWTTTGSGTGSATAGNVGAVSLTTVAPATGLYPGGPAQEVDFRIDNSNPGSVHVSNVTIGFATPATSNASCDASNFALVQPNLGATGVDVPGTSGAGTLTVDGAVSGASIALVNKPTVNQDACKGVTVNLTFLAS